MDRKGKQVIVRCAWCWMFGLERKPGHYDHMERPLTRHPFVPFKEDVWRAS